MNSKLMKTASILLLTGALLLGSAVVPGTPETVYAADETTGSIYIAPVDRAKFLAGARFDFRVELRDLTAKPNQVSITINGRPAEAFFGRSFVITNTHEDSEEYTIRDVMFRSPGLYEVEVKAGELQRKIQYEVIVADQYGKKAKNVIFFNGDGMSHAVITAARILSKGMTEGKYNGLLEMDMMEARGVVTTSGLDSIATDSANSASAYATGHKGEMNALGVYPDNTPDSLDNPRVETIIEMLKRTSGKATGIVSTAELQDASPAAGVAHTRRRGDKAEIAEMFYKVQPDVILGGGSAYFLPQSVPGSSRKDDQDFFKLFEEAGYHIVENRTQLLQVDAGKTDRLFGVFHLGNMDTYYDRSTNNTAVLGSFTDQPTLWEMTQTAIEVLSKNEEGFFLMVEAGSIDKQLHPLDWERAVIEAIEMDKAIGVAKRFAEQYGDTLIVVTADHAHSMSITGTYWEGDGKSGKDAVRTYAEAGFPTYVDADGDGFPDELDVERKLAVHFANHPDYYEDYKMDPVPTTPNVNGEPNPAKLLNPDDPDRDRFLQIGPINGSTGVHTVEDVPLMAHGTGSQYFIGVLDNTEVFFAIAHAMGLQLLDSETEIGELVQLRPFVESLNGTITYNGGNTVELKIGLGTARLNLTSGDAVVNGQSLNTDVKIMNQRTYVTPDFAAKLLELLP
ncbi:alkaline phosphatase [Insulibacter thermoxylanivorax]|uniref:Alkaline phosphatase n=1 Tax=Insulibacter thermoxylanivorax TaxID=2749268 RepID=A0A916VFW9_9BACL|nr:alkaline phosphatase [Insulibacter thermoxylanivorax]GFR38752.1 alkaline phosphatase [Insulibacter thermoxylanivorax]